MLVRGCGGKDESMSKLSLFLLIALAVSCLIVCSLAQPAGLSTYPDITGNSIAMFQGGFQPYYQAPLMVPAPNITIFGMNSYTCVHILPFITYIVPAKATHVVLFDSTNDVNTNVPITDHMNCMYKTINALIARSPKIKLFVANTPPQVEGCYGCLPCNDHRSLTDIYNAAYRGDPGSGFLGLQSTYPHNVKVVDVWTPNALPDDYADPQYMTGPCGVHPGPANQYTGSWEHFAKPYLDAIRTSYGKQW